jgi:hypothetical protein
MATKHFYSASDFALACKKVEEAGFTIDAAAYHGRHFGNWTIELSSEGLKPHLIVWDGRDRWMVLQSHRGGEEWLDEWVVREPQHDTVEQIIARLRN